jgi:RNA polymerase sigma-70 factor (ECF subfamily)
MTAYLGGDRAAFDELYRRYAGLLLRFLGKGMSREETGDLVQQTFLHLHRSRADFREGSHLRPWLFTIAINVKRQYLRTCRRRGEVALELSALPGSAPGPFHADDLERSVRAAWAELPQDQREAIRLHWIEGFSFREIAQTVGATANAVKVRAHRGYVQLRIRLGTERVTKRLPE